MRVLITGAAGFLGYHTSRAILAQGYETVLVDNLFRGERDRAFQELLEDARAEYHALDLTRADSWEALGGHYDAVFHFAAINGTRHFYEQPYEVLERNIELVRLMLQWHHRFADTAQIIWTSSSEVYAGVPGVHIPTAEDTPVGIDDVFKPRYSYAVSKLAGECLVINYARGKDVRYTIVRPHNIYGPRMGYDHVIPQFIVRIKQHEEPFRIHGGHQTRAFCYVDDFVNGVVSLLSTRAAEGEVIHLGDDRLELPIHQLAERLFRIARWHPPVERLEAPPGSVSRRKPDLRKSRRLLNYEPRTGLDEGLSRTYEWYLAH